MAYGGHRQVLLVSDQDIDRVRYHYRQHRYQLDGVQPDYTFVRNIFIHSGQGALNICHSRKRYCEWCERVYRCRTQFVSECSLRAIVYRFAVIAFHNIAWAALGLVEYASEVLSDDAYGKELASAEKEDGDD